MRSLGLASLIALAVGTGLTVPTQTRESEPPDWTRVVSGAGDLSLALPPWLQAFDTSGAVFANEVMAAGQQGLQLLAEGPKTAEPQPRSTDSIQQWLERRVASAGMGAPSVSEVDLPVGKATVIERVDRAGTVGEWRFAAYAYRTPTGVAYLLIDGPPARWEGRDDDVARIARLLRTSAQEAAASTVPMAAPPPTSAPDDLRALIEDVGAATEHRYRLTDDRGRWMDTAKPISVPGSSLFAAVYHTWSEEDQALHVHLALSTDLLSWTWQVELAVQAAMPTIAAVEGGSFVVAWEQEPDPIHMVIASYATWDDLLRGIPDRRFDVPIRTVACGEGTPSIDRATRDRVDLSFHFHSECEVDRQASGWTDWTSWYPRPEPERNRALTQLGVGGHIGDRDRILWRGSDLMLLEGQLTLDDWSSWRVFMLDLGRGSTQMLNVQTDAGSTSIGNPTIGLMDVAGRPAVVVTLYLFTEGAKGAEDGPLLYYRWVEG